jgi:hypothetical protein
MENYKYTIVVNDDTGLVYGADTTNWQEAIDLFHHGRTLGNCELVVLDGEIGGLRYITDIEGIQRWSEHLMNLRYNEQQEADEEEEMFKNRILGRIAQEADGMEVVEPQESHGEFMTRSHKEADDKPDFHGDFSAMDKWTQEQIINPKHYKIVPAEAYSKHPEGLEYMDVMEYALSHLSGVEAHTMGHVFKYAFRIGKKDAKLQDAKKIAWYANRMVEILEYPEETLMSEDTIITTLDQEGKCKDVEVIIDAGSMFLRQWSEDMEDYGLIEISNQQLKDIVAAI